MGLERDANGHQPDSTTYSPQAHGAGAEPEEGYADLSTASAWSILDTALKGTPLSLLLQDENLVYMWAVNMPVQWGGIQFQGKNDKELPYSDDTYQDLRKIKESILKTGIPILHEEWMTAPDGTQLYLRLSMERYIFTNGRRGLLTSMLNLTEQMLVEDKLREFGDKLGVDNIQFELENVRLLSENRRYGIDNAALDQENKAGAVAMRRMGVDNTQYEQENQRLTSENTKFGIDNASLNQENKVGAVALRRLTYEKDAKQQELNEARDLQLAMLPRSFPQPDSFDIAAYMATSVEVGGDYYDFKELGNGGFVAALGDATGHGTRAGIIVSSVKAISRSLRARNILPKFWRQCRRVYAACSCTMPIWAWPCWSSAKTRFATPARACPLCWYTAARLRPWRRLLSAHCSWARTTKSRMSSKRCLLTQVITW